MRYLLFGSSDTYYANGGGWDFLSQSENIEDLHSEIRIQEAKGIQGWVLDWWHIFDSKVGKVISCSPPQPYGVEDYMFEHLVREST